MEYSLNFADRLGAPQEWCALFCFLNMNEEEEHENR